MGIKKKPKLHSKKIEVNPIFVGTPSHRGVSTETSVDWDLFYVIDTDVLL